MLLVVGFGFLEAIGAAPGCQAIPNRKLNKFNGLKLTWVTTLADICAVGLRSS